MPPASCHSCMFARSDSYGGLSCYHSEAELFSRIHGIQHPKVERVITKCDEQGWHRPDKSASWIIPLFLGGASLGGILVIGLLT